MSASVTTAKTRIYPVSPIRRALYAVPIGGIFATFSFILLRDPGNGSRWVIGVVLLFVTLIFLGGYWLVAYARLELSAAGVRARNLGLTVETPWENVEGVCLDRGQEGFITREPINGGGAKRMADFGGVGPGGVSMFGETALRLRRERRFIPLETFAWYFRHGDLAAQVDRVAPHLRMQEALASYVQPAAPPRTPRQRRNLWLLGLLVVAYVGAPPLLDHFAPRVYKNYPAVIIALSLVYAAPATAIGAWKSLRQGKILYGLFGLLSALVLAFLFLMALAAVFM